MDLPSRTANTSFASNLAVEVRARRARFPHVLARPFTPLLDAFLHHRPPLSMPRAASSNTLTAQNQQELISEGIENFELPKSVVTKIAKSAVREGSMRPSTVAHAYF